jgi:cyclase
MPYDSSFPNSKHFTIEPLAEGVYAVISRKGGSAACNSGIIDLGGLSLVFDSFLTPTAAEDLLRSTFQILGHDPDLVINSHYHNDHIWGNQVFGPGVHILASNQTCHLMMTDGKKELEDEIATAARSLAHFKDALKKADSEMVRNDAELFAGAYADLVKDLPRLAVRLPDILFEKRLSFKGKKRTAELIAYERCHTGSDAVLYLPEDRILFMGDLLFIGCHPYLGNGDPVNLIKTVREIKGFEADRFVPGHGTPGGRESISLMIVYIEKCIETVETLVKAGRADKETIDELMVPDQFRQWQFSLFYQSNLRFLISHAQST